MSDAPLPNSPEARTETGELKPGATQAEPTGTSTTPDTTSTTTTPSTTPEASATDGKDKSLLNQGDGEAKPDDKKDDKKTEGAPEAYADFTAKEGYEINKDMLEKAVPVFKELGLNQEQAQKLVDFSAELTAKIADDGFQAYQKMRQDWQTEIKSDKDLGSKLPEVKATIGKAIDTLGDPALQTAFREAMDLTGAGDNPAFVRAFYKFAQRLTEGAHVSGAAPSPHGQGGPKAAPGAHALYPNLA